MHTHPGWSAQAPAASSLAWLEYEVQLRAVGPPRLQVVVAHLAADGCALVLLLVKLEVGVCNPGLVKPQGLSRIGDNALHGRLRYDAHARSHAHGGVSHEDLADFRGAGRGARLALWSLLHAREGRDGRGGQKPKGGKGKNKGAEDWAPSSHGLRS